VSETTLAVLAIAILSVVSCACFVVIFWTAHDRRLPLGPPRKPTVIYAAADPHVDRKAERRNAAVIFIGFLIGLAYQEAVSPVRDALDDGQFTLVTAGLVTTFFFLGLSTFFGGFFHLLVAPWKGLSWVCNFFVIVLEAVILVFMAGVCTESASTGTPWDMFRWALVYSVLIAAWALAIFVSRARRRGIRKIGRSMRQSLVDTWVAATLIALISFAVSDRYATVAALLLAAVCVAHFGRDMQILIREGLI
jgi:hypothetical protein